MRFVFRTVVYLTCLIVAVGPCLTARQVDPVQAVPAAPTETTVVPTPTAITPYGVVFSAIDSVPMLGLYYPATRQARAFAKSDESIKD